eukprot:1145192-Pelagomonas_calceolata.AAC.4
MSTALLHASRTEVGLKLQARMRPKARHTVFIKLQACMHPTTHHAVLFLGLCAVPFQRHFDDCGQALAKQCGQGLPVGLQAHKGTQALSGTGQDKEGVLVLPRQGSVVRACQRNCRHNMMPTDSQAQEVSMRTCWCCRGKTTVRHRRCQGGCAGVAEARLCGQGLPVRLQAQKNTWMIGHRRCQEGCADVPRQDCVASLPLHNCRHKGAHKGKQAEGGQD